MKRIKYIFSLIVIVVLFNACHQKDRNIQSLDDLKTAEIGVQTGMMTDQIVLSKLPDAKFLYFNSNLDACEAVKKGKIIACAGDEPLLRNIVTKNKELRILSDMISYDDYALGFNMKDTHLKQVADSVIDEIKANGRYDEMLVRWYLKEGKRIADDSIVLDGKNGVLRMATCANIESFSYVQNKNIIGFDIELVKLIAQRLGMQLEIANVDFGGLIPSLVSGKCDVIASCITVSEERAKKILFSKTYYKGGIAVVVKNNLKPEDKYFSSIEDINNETVAVVVGTTQDEYITKTFPSCDIIRMETQADMLPALLAGHCEIVVEDGVTAKMICKKNPEIAIFKENVYKESFGFCFHDADLCHSFNDFLSKLKQSGELTNITNNWFNDPDNSKVPDFDFSAFDETINIATCGVLIPFTFMRDNNVTGMDVDILTRFAFSIKKKPVFQIMNFSALIPSIKANKSDIAGSGMTITEERAKQVIFSDPYVDSYSSMLALKKNVKNNENTDKLKSVKDLENKRIGVLIGSAQDEYATKNFPDAQFLRLLTYPDLTMALKRNQCDAVLLCDVSATYVFEKNKDIVYLDDYVMNNDFSVGFSKSNKAMALKFNAFLKEIKENGVYDQMYNRWILKGETAKMPEIPNKGLKGVLPIATTGESIPFSFYKNNVLTGFDIEMLTRFAAYIGKKPEFKIMNFDAMLASCMSGKSAIIVNSIMVTPEREKNILFSDSYFRAKSGFLVLSDRISNGNKRYVVNNDGGDLSSSIVGAMTGTTGEIYLNKHCPHENVRCFDDICDAIAALQSNKIKYVMTAYTTATVAAHKNELLAVLPREYIMEGAVIAVQKGNPKLLNDINRIIRSFKHDGTLNDVVKRWINFNGEKVADDPIPVLNNAPVLRVGIAANREPMCFVKNGKIVGLDCELIERIAYNMGMRVEYSDMKFSALVTSLAAGKVDVVISNLTPTEERGKMVDFSDSYFTNPQVLLTTQTVVNDKNNSDNWFSKVKDSFYNNIILEKRYLLIWDGLKVTFFISILSALLGTILGAAICFMRMSKNKIARAIAKVYIDLLRGIPQVVLLMIMFYVVFAKLDISGVMVASITFALNFAAYVSEMFRTAISGIDKGQTEASIALGFNKVKTFCFIVLPQAVRRVLPVYKGEFIALVKMTSIVGYIAVQDLTKASDIIRSRTFDAFFPLIMVAILYFVLAWLLTLLLNYAEFKTTPKRRKDILPE